MKMYGILCLFVAVIMLLAPLAAIHLGPPHTEDSSESVSEEDEADEPADKEEGNKGYISVFMSAEGKTEDMPIRDYIVGAVAAEMPASYHAEALKAQALAAVTFAVYMQNGGKDDSAEGADISDDSNKHQGYISKEKMREKWGDAFDSYYEKIADAVDEVIDQVITYQGEPIMAAYHAISAGQTESAADIWGREIPYLTVVDSADDKNSPRYASEEIFSFSELKEAFSDVDGIDFSQKGTDFIRIKNTTDSGTVTSLTVGGHTMTGMEVRNILKLRSPVFSVEYEDGDFIFSVKGYGHGVGMSQYGANCLAEQGRSCEEIIQHYYPGTRIQRR